MARSTTGRWELVVATAAALWGLADIARTGVDVAVFRERRPNGLDYRVRRLDPRLGRRGIRIMRNALRERTTGMAPTPSVLSDLFKKIVLRYGLPQPAQEYPIELDGRRRYLDFAYPDVKLAIECDSRTWHLEEPDSYDGDMERGNALQLLGWRLLRFGWAKLRFDQKWVADTVLTHLADLRRAVV